MHCFLYYAERERERLVAFGDFFFFGELVVVSSMAKSENSKNPAPNPPKIHPITANNDLEIDPLNSYSLEKFRLYETRAVSIKQKRVNEFVKFCIFRVLLLFFSPASLITALFIVNSVEMTAFTFFYGMYSNKRRK